MNDNGFLKVNRREFLSALAIGGIGAGLVGFRNTLIDATLFRRRGRASLHPIYGLSDTPEWLRTASGTLKLNPDWVLRHTVDLQCHSECGLRVKIDRKTGRVQRIFGNPYHPNTLLEYANIKTPLIETAALPGSVCARGNSGIQTAFDPYRITVPLKRNGPRGSGQWRPITWKQLLDEVVDGGKIFSDTGDSASKDINVLGFRGLYAKCNELIDPMAPELGHRTNGLLFQGGRIVGSRLEFARRFGKSFGSVNFFEHVNVCEVSHHVATAAIYPGKHMLKPDVREAKFIIFWGTQPGDANFPMQTLAKYTAEARTKPDGLKYVVVDPMLGRGGVIGDRANWMAIKPGTDGAMAMAMIRWIIEQKRYNADYLSHPAQKSAETAGELSHTDATHLIIVDPKHPHANRFLTSEEAGFGQGDGEPDHVVISAASGRATKAAETAAGSIDFSGVVNGIKVKTAFTLLKEAAQTHSLSDYAAICGISEDRIVALAEEFTRHGRKAVSEAYRGVVKHPNGYYNCVAVLLLNLMVGNLNWTGGATFGGGGYGYKKGIYDLMALPGAEGRAYGVKLSREEAHYEETSEYRNKVKAGQNPYPAKRPWFPLSFEVYTELLPSAVQKYPYGIDILMWHMATPFYSVPSQGNQAFVDVVKDPKNIPLIIASDVVVGDTSMYADYIIPDGSYLESWTHIDTLPTTLTNGTGVRWPVIELVQKTEDGRLMCLEEFLIDIGKRLGMVGYGSKGIPDASGKNFWPLNRKEDWYLKATANIAFAKGVGGDDMPDATAEEIEAGDLLAFHDRYQQALRESEWPKVLGVMSRGGRFEPYQQGHDGDRLRHRFTKTLHFYAEEVALTRDSMSGIQFLGTTTWVEPTTALGKLLDSIDDPNAWPLTIITFKGALQSHSRLSSNYVIRELVPDNGILIASADAKHLGIGDGDEIWVVTPEGKRKGFARVRQGLRPGVIAYEVGYGHWGYGATNYQIDGKRVEGDKIRRAGIHLNPILRRDPDIWQMSLMDLVGGSVVFFNTRARLEKDVTHV